MSVRVVRFGWFPFAAWTMVMSPVPQPARPQTETRSFTMNRA